MMGWFRRRRQGRPSTASDTPDITCQTPPHTLAQIPIGGHFVICHLTCQGAIRQRLLDIGLVPGTHGTMVRAAPLNDPIEVHVGRAFITLRRAEAAAIEVCCDEITARSS